jgi:hypothetical protein
LIWEDVVAIWKSEADLETAANLNGEVTEEELEPFVACWAAAGSEAIKIPSRPLSELIHIRVESGDSKGCIGVVLREEYVPSIGLE